jgi:hypothetical protein
MARRLSAWVITVVDPNVNWRTATARALVTEGGLPTGVAARWANIRKEISPSGLKRKLAETRN